MRTEFTTRIRRQARHWPLVLLFSGMLLVLWGCRNQPSSTTLISQELMVEGEEVVVTRVVKNVIEVPVTVTPANPDVEPAVLDIGMSSAPAAVDPQKASSESEITLVENLFVGLTRYNHAARVVEPALAESWEVSDDGRTWTFHLRDDIFWIRSNVQEPTTLLPSEKGPEPYRPVVADDVVYAAQRACNPLTRAPDILVLFIIEGCETVYGLPEATETDLRRIGVRALDDTTVEFTLTKPASYFETIASLWLLRPVPREVVEAFRGSDESWARLSSVLSSGPFTVSEESVEGTRTVLRRNPYWPIPFQGTIEQANIFWLSPAAAYEMWLEKGLDVSPLPAEFREEMMEDRRLNTRVNLVTSQAVFYLAFNFESPVFADPAVRQAFSAAIDREALIEEVYGGSGVPMRHFTPPGVLGAPPVDQVGVGYSPDWARIKMESSSIRGCQFLPEIRYLVSGSDLALHHAETLRDMWNRELNCPKDKIVIDQVQFGTLLASTRSDAGEARPDIWDLGWASYYPDAHNWLGDVLHCTQSENRQNRPCSQVDDLIAHASGLRSVEERWSLYSQIEQQFFSEEGIQPVVPLFVQGQYMLIHPWLNFEPAHFGGEQFDTYQLDSTTKRLERQQ